MAGGTAGIWDRLRRDSDINSVLQAFRISSKEKLVQTPVEVLEACMQQRELSKEKQRQLLDLKTALARTSRHGHDMTSGYSHEPQQLNEEEARRVKFLQACVDAKPLKKDCVRAYHPTTYKAAAAMLAEGCRPSTSYNWLAGRSLNDERFFCVTLLSPIAFGFPQGEWKRRMLLNNFGREAGGDEGSPKSCRSCKSTRSNSSDWVREQRAQVCLVVDVPVPSLRDARTAPEQRHNESIRSENRNVHYIPESFLQNMGVHALPADSIVYAFQLEDIPIEAVDLSDLSPSKAFDFAAKVQPRVDKAARDLDLFELAWLLELGGKMRHTERDHVCQILNVFARHTANPGGLKFGIFDGKSAWKARESGLSLSDMKQIFWRWVRDGNFDIQDLLQAGCPLTEFREAGWKACSLKQQGLFDAAELRGAGYTAHELREASYSSEELHAGGYTLEELQAGGCTAKDVQGLGYSVQQMRAAGYTAEQLRACGFPADHLREGGYRAGELRVAGYSILQLRTGGYTVQEVNLAGYTRMGGIQQLRAAGYTAEELRNGGYTAQEVKKAGYTFQQLRAGGFTVEQLRHDGFKVEQLRAGGFTTNQLRAGGFTAQDVSAFKV